MMPWEIFNKEGNKILSIRPINKDPVFADFNAKLMWNDLTLLNETKQKINNGEFWGVITFKCDIKRICKYEFSADGRVFQIECSTIKYVYDGQTPESSRGIEVDTKNLINYLQDNNHHFIYKDDLEQSQIAIKLK